jgi:hypothetical protein
MSSRIATDRAKRLRWWLWETNWLPVVVCEWLLRLWCWRYGHEYIADNCGRPEHSYCATCRMLQYPEVA